MPSEEKQPAHVIAAQESLTLAFTVIAQVGGFTVLAVIGALVVGLVLDRVLNTRPLFTVLLLLGSFPISFYIIYRVALSAVAKIKPPPAKPTPSAEEDGNRDNNL
jgi:F0F1-type ATP synthase assembly protein I